MPYTPTEWVNGGPPPINDVNLNHIEQGLADLDGVARRYLDTDDTGATDIGADLQAAFDADPVVHLAPGGTYLLDTSVFLDNTNHRHRYTLDLNGSVLVLGTGLAKAAEFLSANTKWGFFNGTLRSALSGGTVTNTSGTLASAPAFPSQPRFLIQNGVVDGQTNDVGLAYGNTAATFMYRLGAYRLKWGISWAGYADGSGASYVHVVSQPTGGWLIKQEDNGDGVFIDRCKGVGAGLWNATNCNGGKVIGTVAGGFQFANCHGIQLDACHNEIDEASGYPFFVNIDRSTVTVNNHFSHAGKAVSRYVFDIDDDSASPDSATDLTLRNCVSTFYIRSTDTDPGRDPALYVTAANNGARIRAYDCRTMVYAQDEDHPPRYREGWYLASADSNVQTAITDGADQLSTGNFEIRQVAGSWAVRAPLNAASYSPTLAAPTLTVAADTNCTGTLTNGQAYYYVAATRNVAGTYSARSAIVNATAGADGAIALALVNSAYPCQVVVWRKTGSGVETTPDHYLAVPLDGYQTHWWDTGVHLNGRTWLTSSIPPVP